MTTNEEISGRKVWFSYKTTKEYLDSIGLSENDVKGDIEYISKCFGFRYLRLFPLKLNSQDIERFHTLKKLFEKIDKCTGFKKFLRQFDKNNIKHHLFTARVAAWLLDLGFDVELEPETDSSVGGKPDILAIDRGERIIVECKDIDISTFFDHDIKKQIAKIVYEKVRTCDQIDIYLSEHLTPNYIESVLSDENLVSEIYKTGANSQESRISVSDKLDIAIIRKPPITGAEEEFLEATLEIILEDVNSGLRLPGYAFMKGGRSVGVFGPPPNYNRRWEDKRSKSKKQAIEGHPMFVIINGDNVLGDPVLHKEFFDRVWLTQNNSNCSAIGLISFATLDRRATLAFYENTYATYKLSDDTKSKMGCA